MKVAFLLSEVGRSGGVQVVLRHARLLTERAGIETEVVVCGPKAALPAEAPGGVALRTLAEAAGRRYDVAVATWWETAESLWEIDAQRRALLLQNVEHRFFGDEGLPDRAAAAGVLSLPVDYVVISRFMQRLLAELRPDAHCVHVPVGIDKGVFRPRAARERRGPLRVLVEGQPTLWFKGVEDALAAVGRMAAPATVTVAVHDRASAGELRADRIESLATPEEMAALYAEHDVVLKLPRFEGLGLPPLEGFHVGLPCVVTPYTGHEEYVVHGRNGLVVGFDDLDAAARALDALAGDQELYDRLSAGALVAAASWPGVEAATDALADALRELAAAPVPDAAAAQAAAQLDRRMWRELTRDHERRLAGALAWSEHELADTRGDLDRVNASRDECAELLAGARAELEDVRSERAYRLAVALRRLLPRRGG